MTKTLTFAETLHPEDAAEFIDPENIGPQGVSPWTAVYNEVRDAPPAIAVAEQVLIDEEDEPPPRPALIPSAPHESHAGENFQEGAPKPEEEEIPDQPSGYGCFGIEGLIGLSLTFSAVLAAFIIEICSALVYCLAAFFYWISPPGRHFIWLRVMFMLIAQMLLVIDAVLLSTNVLVTEIIACILCLLTTCFGGTAAGHAWHMYVRKVCHLTRWAFRGFHEGWQPERIFPVAVVPERERAQNSAGGAGGQQPTTGQEQAKVAPNDPEVGQSPPSAAEYVIADHVVIVDSKDSTAAAASNPMYKLGNMTSTNKKL
jgi:hypothetical protein